MMRMVIGLMVVATVIGAMMPGRSGDPSSNASAAAAEPWFADDGSSLAVASESPSRRSRNDGDPGGSGGEVRLTRHQNGHFYADVEINGTSTEFMIDTGATGIAMTEAAARRANIALDPGEASYIGEGAGGALTGQRVTLERVRLGSRSATGMDAVVIDGASTNLLGQSFLSKFAEVTVRGDVMTLR